MKIFEKKSLLSSYILNLKLKNKTISLVPTMGYLHNGHLELVKKAKEMSDIVVVSIFLNPTQFDRNEDLESYPTNIKNDIKLLEKLDVDILFTPTPNEMYGKNSTITVNPGESSKILCGEFRGKHFTGVLTVVNKLFNIIKPDYAIFGKKDAQQLLLINKMVNDLDMNISTIGVDTVREDNGLAMSSRNTNLNSEEIIKASSIFKSFKIVQNLIKNGEKNVKNIINYMLENINSDNIEYVEAIDINNFKKIENIDKNTLFAVAVYYGKTRLIDNFFVKDII